MDMAVAATRIREVLDNHDWCKWHTILPTDQSGFRAGSVCLGGAINEAYSTRASIWLTPGTAGYSVYKALAQIIREQWPDRFESGSAPNIVIAWNDHPATTRDDVRVLLDKLEARGEVISG